VIEIHLLADQVAAFEDEDQYTLNFHRPRSRFDACPDATMRAAEFSFDNHRSVRMMKLYRMKHRANQCVNCSCAVRSRGKWCLALGHDTNCRRPHTEAPRKR
jgi:hypothetical protein